MPQGNPGDRRRTLVDLPRGLGGDHRVRIVHDSLSLARRYSSTGTHIPRLSPSTART